jgi:hypothetical protein
MLTKACKVEGAGEVASPWSHDSVLPDLFYRRVRARDCLSKLWKRPARLPIPPITEIQMRSAELGLKLDRLFAGSPVQAATHLNGDAMDRAREGQESLT